MMRSILFVCGAAFLLAGCGIRRPLIAPADIPAHEEKIRKKYREREEFKRELQAPTPVTPQT
jgi:hypothetical protein